MKYNRFSRRMFLQGSGALLSIPFLESLAPSEARAQSAEPVKRYLFFNVNYDIGHARNWLPQLTTLANPLDIPGTPHKGSFERLASIRARKTQLSPIFGTAFDPFIDKMMFYKGLDIPSWGPHQNGALYHLGNMWSIGNGSLDPYNGAPGRNPATETFDRLIAKHPKFDPGKRPAYNLYGGGGNFVWEKDALGIPRAKGGIAWNAQEAYNIIFNNGSYPESGAAPLVHSRRDLLTRVMEDYSRVINGRQIGASDKIVLTSALDSVADLQRGLTTQATNSCRHKGILDSRANQGDFALTDSAGWANYTKLIIAIFQCDISRSLIMNVSAMASEDWTRKPVNDWHENITHDAQGVFDNQVNWRRVGDYYGRHFSGFIAPALTQLDACIDPANNKSFLHNGLVHLTAESNIPHRQVSLPNATVGSLNGALPTGYMVNYTDPSRWFNWDVESGSINGAGGWSDNPKDATDQYNDLHTYDYVGIPYQRFIVTLAQAMGLSPSDYEDPALNHQLINRNDSLFGEHNNGITHMGGFGIASMEKIDDIQNTPLTPENRLTEWHAHVMRMRRYNWHHYKYPVPLPPKV